MIVPTNKPTTTHARQAGMFSFSSLLSRGKGGDGQPPPPQPQQHPAAQPPTSAAPPTQPPGGGGGGAGAAAGGDGGRDGGQQRQQGVGQQPATGPAAAGAGRCGAGGSGQQAPPDASMGASCMQAAVLAYRRSDWYKGSGRGICECCRLESFTSPLQRLACDATDRLLLTLRGAARHRAHAARVPDAGGAHAGDP